MWIEFGLSQLLILFDLVIPLLYGKFDSTMNMKGASVIERPNEAIENIFSFRKVVVRGPAYSSSSWTVEVVWLSVFEVSGLAEYSRRGAAPSRWV